MIASSAYPRLTLSTASSAPCGYRTYRRLAGELGADGIELDLTTWIGNRRPGLPPRAATSQEMPLAGVWLPTGAAERLPRAIDRLGAAEGFVGVGDLVMRLHDGASPADDQAAIVATRRRYDAAGHLGRLVVAAPAVAPEGGRAHLYRLNVVRRLAEEWGLALALDLTPRTDNRWEAEAAMQAVGRHLVAIRLRSSLVDHASQNAEIHRRALRAAADAGFCGRIVLAPVTPWWLAWHRPSVGRDLLANRDLVQRLLFERRVPTGAVDRISLL